MMQHVVHLPETNIR